MKKVSIFCLLMFLGLLSYGFAVDAYAQLNRVTIVSPAGTSITSPQQGEYVNGDSMNITWEDEHPVSGENFWVRWTSPENYFSYRLRYSFDKIAWEDIGSDIRVRECLWKVPVVEQSRRCWIKVIGFDANGEKKGAHTRLVYIRVRPAVSVNISYSINGGKTWRSITQIPYAIQYTWEDSNINSRKCRFGNQVKVVMKDGNDRTVGSAVSAKFTAISDQPPRLAGSWSGYYYSAESGTIPVFGTIDGENRYNFVGELPFGKARFLGRFYGNCVDAEDDGTLAITGDGTAYAPPGHLWSNDEATAAIDLDAETNAAMAAMEGSWAMSDELVGSFHIDRE